MYLIYADESGDIGQNNSNTRYFILSSIIIHESNWFPFLNDLNQFRISLKTRYGLLKSEEIHASVFANGRPSFRNNISFSNRINILLDCLTWLGSRNDISIITVRNDKHRPASDIFDFSWRTFIQRFENTLRHRNFAAPGVFTLPNEFYLTQRATIFSDNTDGGKLRKLLREMRRVNYVPNVTALYYGGTRNIPLQVIIEDPVLRDSAYSYLHQMVDVVAYFAKQIYQPNKYFVTNGLTREYGRLSNVVNQFATSSNTTPFKIVEI